MAQMAWEAIVRPSDKNEKREDSRVLGLTNSSTPLELEGSETPTSKTSHWKGRHNPPSSQTTPTDRWRQRQQSKGGGGSQESSAKRKPPTHHSECPSPSKPGNFPHEIKDTWPPAHVQREHDSFLCTLDESKPELYSPLITGGIRVNGTGVQNALVV
ncbi:hypothetical protein SKAU_G00139960 [Synaphobranchus kaupii]|uniref:Uncharacterized protein n=1 Tax=Synaphobranchus kaupii TaxID=118154 RepID=A0A9Q1J4B6_SYNKA|nr:hypothetical protein SKAU_G00139960 [Synaphobranchus kaupii]